MILLKDKAFKRPIREETNMPRPLIISLAAITGIVILVKTGLFDAIFWLLFAGVIPGTRFSIPPTLMLVLYIIAGVFVVKWALKNDLYVGSPTVRAEKYRANQKKRPALRRKRTVATKSNSSRKKTTARRRYSQAKTS